jgi:predicted nucleotidyltransferase
MTDFKALLRTLSGSGVEFILVGGVAATVHGSARLTLDVDVVYARSPGNLERLAAALAPHHPYLRGAPPGLPFRWEAATLQRGLNFTLTTDIGDDALLPASMRVQVLGVEVRCLTLECLIEVKRAAGRPKDLEAIAELEAILEERDRGL